MTLRSIQFWTTFVVLALAPLCFGSVDLLWVVVWTIVLSVSALIGVFMPMDRQQSRLVSCFLVLCFSYALVAVIQVIPNFAEQFNDPSWARANELLGLNVSPRISIRAEISPIAAGHFFLLATSFTSGFTVGTSRDGAEKFFVLAQYALLLYVIYGIAALVFTPNLVLWAPKLIYLKSFTTTFINHNTAATFVGAGMIMWFCYAFSALQSLGFSSIRMALLTASNENLALSIIARSSIALICFFALLLTGSRGGLISSCLGLLVAIMLMITKSQTSRFWSVALGGGVALAVTLALLSQMGRIGADGLLDANRWSVYEFCVEAIRQRPFFGAGVGTFEDLFPSLRADSFASGGVWDYAHSTILEIAVEMGIPVAAMIVMATIASIVILARAAIKAKGRSRRSLASIAGIAILSYLHSTIDFSLQIPGYLIVFGILLGCGLARASAMPEKDNRNEEFVYVSEPVA